MFISLIFYIYMQTLSIKVTSKSKIFYYNADLVDAHAMQICEHNFGRKDTKKI